MTWQHVSLSDCAPQAWRNGGGLTHELATWPSTQDWRWRASVARIDRDGAFSAFEGVQRWFAVLSGEGVTLSWPERQVSLTPHSEPIHFAGTPACDACLIGGPTLDFNLMTRNLHGELIRHPTRHPIEHLSRPPSPETHAPQQGTWPAHAHVGVFACTDCVWQSNGDVAFHQRAHSLRWTHLDQATPWTWLEGEALVFVLHDKDET